MIDLVDNQRSEELSKSEIEDFLPLANKDIRKLCEENKRLLVFPHSLDMSNDKIEYNPLFVVDDYKKEYLRGYRNGKDIIENCKNAYDLKNK